MSLQYDITQLEIQAIRKELLELCTETAQKFLVQGKYDLAVPGALQSLRFAIEICGSEGIQLVSSYLLLAEANLGLRRLKVAEEFLSLANWNLLKKESQQNEENVTSLMSHLQRNFGRLYAAQQRLIFSNSVFCVSAVTRAFPLTSGALCFAASDCDIFCTL